MEKQVEKKESTVIAPEANHQLADYGRNFWLVDAEAGTTIEHVLEPVYWSHVAAKMKPHDRVDVRVATGEWMIELYVLDCGRNWARVHVLHKHEFEATQEPEEKDEFMVEFKGPKMKHCVIRKADMALMAEGISSKVEAFAWIANYQRVVA